MEQSCSASQEITHVLWNQKVRYRVHKSPPFFPVLSLINKIQAAHTISWRSILVLSSYLITGLPKYPLPFGFPHQDPVRASVLPHPCRKSGPSHSSVFDHPSNNWWRVKIIKCLVIWEVAGILKTSVIIKDEISVPCRPRPNGWHSCL
jgi:hypothetical protein